VLLTLTTTHVPATDLGYLLVKHPARVHAFDVPTGTAYVCFPEASAQRCTAALILDVDPNRLGGGPGRGQPSGFSLGRYVNDRPYAASSLLAAALNRAFRSAMRGESRDRPELAATAIDLTVRIPALRCRGGVELAIRLLEPLGWRVAASAAPLDPAFPQWGESRYLDLSMTGMLRVADALNQLYVLLPVFDDAKHYWVSSDEVDKLLRAGTGWLAAHPERDLISRRYLAHSQALAWAASQRIEALRAAEAEPDPGTVEGRDPAAAADEEADLPQDARVPLARQRRRAVLAELERSGAASVLDLGCGPGALLSDLMRDKRFTRIVGVDISTQALAAAQKRLRLDRAPERQRDRVSLLQSALTYADDRLVGFDAAVLMEVVEHVDPPRLASLAAAVFGHAGPSTVVITTPNKEYNVRYRLTAAMRHHDHRFEWNRAEFGPWCAEVASRYGYEVRVTGVGEPDPELGCPTQLATFTRAGAR
jgi:3' terminal RNA ribose 2'-O-methyltransferase Hen1